MRELLGLELEAPSREPVGKDDRHRRKWWLFRSLC